MAPNQTQVAKYEKSNYFKQSFNDMTSSRAIWFQVIDYGKKSWNMKVGLVHEVASWNFCLKNKISLVNISRGVKDTHAILGITSLNVRVIMIATYIELVFNNHRIK